MASIGHTHWSPASGGQGGLHLWALQIWNNWRDCSWQVTSSRVLHRQHIETTPTKSIYEKRPIYLSWSFSLRSRFQVYHTSSSHRGALRGCRPADAISELSWPHYSLPDPPKKELILLSRDPSFATVPKDTALMLGLEASRVYDCGPTGVCMSAYLKSCCLRI